MVDDIVDTSEVIDCFQDVVNTDSHFSNANGVRLKDIAFGRESAYYPQCDSNYRSNLSECDDKCLL